MSLLNQNCKEGRSLRRVRSRKDITDFSKVGGLSYHLKILREVIILPLLHGNIFSSFKIKAPKGVLFHGPPGTGKTLVAGALASEINREGIGKVSFFQRKGADILNKWVGESEKNLRILFDKATKCRPSIIFFDELDGLAPIRSEKNDHIHSSVVTTLLALMDGLDVKPGVIVIGATNRIDAIDPALRRPGRFDKELYFPLPGVESRKEIIQVHTSPWTHKPSAKFINHLAEITTGFSGCDIQALCSEAVLCCLRRLYPTIERKGCSNIKIEAESLMVEECDFHEATKNLVPSCFKLAQNIRSLNPTIKPLLFRQHEKIVRYIWSLWPHFMQEKYRYNIGDKRYAGRVILIGSNLQGLNNHLVPAILRDLEHLPSFVYDASMFDRVRLNSIKPQNGLPTVIILSRIDEWWEFIDDCEKESLVSNLEDIHAGLPVLVIVTCKTNVPEKLHNFFYNNSSILIEVEDPNEDERENFLAPLFFDEKQLSLFKVFENTRASGKKIIKSEKDNEHHNNMNLGSVKKRHLRKNTISSADTDESINISEDKQRYTTPNVTGTINCKRKRDNSNHALDKRIKLCEGKFGVWRSKSANSLYDIHNRHRNEQGDDGVQLSTLDTLSTLQSQQNKLYFTRVLADIINHRSVSRSSSGTILPAEKKCRNFIRGDLRGDQVSVSSSRGSTYKKNTVDDNCMKCIYGLWKHASLVTSRKMTVAHLEKLYDAISACISINQCSFDDVIEKLSYVLKKVENAYQVTINGSED